MTEETADYIITEIVRLSTELEYMQDIADITLPLGLVLTLGGAIACVIMFIHCRRVGEEFILYFSTWAIVTVSLALMLGFIADGIYMMAMFDIPHVQTNLDNLVMMYEALYGPLPGGLI